MNDSSSNNCESTHQPEVVMDVDVDAKRSSATSATRIMELRTERTRLLTEQIKVLIKIQKEVNAATKRQDDIKMELLTARKAKCGCCPLWRSQLISNLDDDLRSAEESLSEAQQKYKKNWDTLTEYKKAFNTLTEREEGDSGLRTPIEKKLVQTLSSTSPSAPNPWKSPEDLREQSAKHYGCYRLCGNAIFAKCIVTGIEGDRKKVTNAHLLPRNASKHFLDELCMTFVDDQKNMIFLCLEIYKAFELQKLCFIPEEQDQFSTCYRLKIWDDRTREKPLFSGATETIGDYESKSFCFPDGKAPYSRVLSLHAQWSYQTAIEQGWINPRDEPKPEIYGTPMEKISFRDMAQQDSTTIVATETANSSNVWNSPQASDTSNDAFP